MKIYFTVHPYLSGYIFRSAGVVIGEWELKDGMTVREIVARIAFPEDAEILAVVNDVSCLDKDRPIRDGDSLMLLPVISGG
jgi:sulfur carrier protein ThiS